MLKAIVNFLNLKLELLNYFDLTRCLCELKTKGDVVAPKEYIANGEFQNIDFDSSDGVSYWRLRDPITVTRESNPNKALKRVQTTVPMKLVFSVRRDKLTTDDAYSFDRIRQTVVKQFNIDNGALTTALGAAKVTITAPSSDGDPLSVWDAETSGTETQEPDFKFVFGSIDIDIVIDSDTECLPTECDDVDSDILHTFDFCDAAVRDRLTDAQVTCLEDALCGVCADATVQLNGSTIGTVASGATDTFPVTQDGSPVGSWNGSAWIIPPATSATLTVEVFSDAGYTTPITATTYNQTIYIRATPTGTTPTGYVFFAFNGVEIFPIGEQVGNEISGEVPFLGSYGIYANTLGTETIYGSESLTGSSESDAAAYILAHNAASSLTMADNQQLVVNEVYARFKGARTTNNNNLWIKLSTANAEIYPFAPVSNSVTSLPTIAVDMVNPSTLATIVNFLSTDVEVDGVTSSSTKWMELKNKPSDFGQDDVGADVYYKSGGAKSEMYTGAYEGNMTNGVFFSSQYCGVNNSFKNSNLPLGIGLLSVNRNNAANFQLYQRAAQTNSITAASTAPPSLPFFGFGSNRDGSPDTSFGRKFAGKLAMIANRSSFTTDELSDWEEIWEYYMKNIVL